MMWDLPQSDGGSDLTGYTIQKRDAKKSTYISCGNNDAGSRTCKVAKLTEGNEYYIRVCAENVIGISDPTENEEPIMARLPFGKSIEVHGTRII